jgi:hypothetical protein
MRAAGSLASAPSLSRSRAPRALNKRGPRGAFSSGGPPAASALAGGAAPRAAHPAPRRGAAGHPALRAPTAAAPSRRRAAVVAMATGGGRDLLIVGPGVLGAYAGKLWKEAFPDATVVAQTNTTASHERCAGRRGSGGEVPEGARARARQGRTPARLLGGAMRATHERAEAFPGRQEAPGGAEPARAGARDSAPHVHRPARGMLPAEPAAPRLLSTPAPPPPDAPHRARHRLQKLHLTPRTREQAASIQQRFPYVLFAAPPSGSEDYPGEVRRGRGGAGPCREGGRA